MFPLQSLPLPIRLLIYYTILYTRSIPLTTLLVLSRESHSFVRAEVYRRVSLTSLRQLEAFGRSDGVKRDGRMVRVLRVHLGGGSTIAGISPLLGKAIELTPNLDEIELVCYTLRVDPHRKLLLKGLQAINPMKFSWSSPDPSHQFTIATFSTHLVPIFRSYTRLGYLDLSNVSFAILSDPSRGEAPFPPLPTDADLVLANPQPPAQVVEGAEGWVGAGVVLGLSPPRRTGGQTFRLPDVLIGTAKGEDPVRRGGSLDVVRIRKAVFVDPEVVLNLLIDVEMAKKRLDRGTREQQGVMKPVAEPAPRGNHDDQDDDDEQSSSLNVVLEDVYLESIWGSRLRMRHLEECAKSLGVDARFLERITVGGRCERIHGGDRFE